MIGIGFKPGVVLFCLYGIISITFVSSLFGCYNSKLLCQKTNPIYKEKMAVASNVKRPFSIKGKYRGAVFSAKGVISLNSLNELSVSLYTPFGNKFGELQTAADSVSVIFDDINQTFGLESSIQALPYFSDYPFNFIQFNRIIAGRLDLSDSLLNEKVGVLCETNVKFLEFYENGFNYTLITSGRKGLVATMQTLSKEKWKLTFSEWRGVFFNSVEFYLNESDFFHVEFEA